jgi:hypothetical protein
MEKKKIAPRGLYTEAKIAQIQQRNADFNKRWELAMSKIPEKTRKMVAPLVHIGCAMLETTPVSDYTISRTKSRHTYNFTVLEALERVAKIFEK